MTYTEPLMLVFLVVTLIGLVPLRGCRGMWLASLGVSGLLLVSWPPVDWLLFRPLEARYPVRPFQSAPAQAIVVLSSAVIPPQYARPYPVPDQYTYLRCEFAAWLYRNWLPVPVVASGGPGRPGQPAYSVTMRGLLQRAGVPAAMIWTEERSRSIHENAVYAAEILRRHGIRTIALVVEARSMPRARACFLKEGFTVVPAPSVFRELGGLSEELIPSWRAVQSNEMTLHETLGLAWYWLHDWV